MDGLNVLVFMHAAVIDGADKPSQSDVTVVVTGDRITAIGRDPNTTAPANAVVADATRKYLIPGLWDATALRLMKAVLYCAHNAEVEKHNAVKTL